MKIAQIFINQLNSNVDNPFDYYMPEELNIEIGHRVIVPFGFKNKLIDAVVIGIKESSEFSNLKKVRGVVKNFPKLTKWQIDICFWMRENYHCLFMEAVNSYIPSGLQIKKKSVQGVEQYYLSNFEQVINYYKLSGKYSIKEEYIGKLRANAVKQKEIIEALGTIPISARELREKTNFSSSALNTLIDKDLVEVINQLDIRNPYKNKDFKYPENKLNPYQEHVLQIFMQAKTPSTFLLHGVTGSGKTEVFLQMIEETIKKGKGCIYLVPEISLTSQIIGRIMGRFQKNIGIIHSNLSVGERIDQYTSIKDKKYNIVLGARSAIFAPMDNIGLIILDEEHENTYKSSNRPRYNTQAIAKKLQEYHNCKIVLGSATPSIDSYYKAKNNDMILLELPYRANKKSMPNIEIVDMKDELYVGNRSVLSRKLYKNIQENLENKEQTILFLNKRGYSSFVFCRSCGYSVTCPHCEISMTYHHNTREMICHYCGHRARMPQKCPKCESDKIKYTGSGTQKLELQIKKHFPTARIVRMDADSMRRKGAYDRVLDTFSRGEADILLGTQMVTKGFDFKNVTLAGVILADATLNIPDFKSSERTFQLLTQVAGRSGRGDKQGRVVVQTYEMDHYAINFAKEYDYEGFYNAEIKYRKMMEYPPFSDIIYIGFTNADEKLVAKECKKYYNNYVKTLKDHGFKEHIKEVYAPNPSPVKKIKNKYRWYFILKTNNLNIHNKLIYELNKTKEIMDFKSAKIIDINPNSIL